MAKINATTIIQPKDTDFIERLRQDLERDVQNTVHARRAALRLVELKVRGLLRRLPSREST